jgi:hypothetical protein
VKTPQATPQATPQVALEKIPPAPLTAAERAVLAKLHIRCEDGWATMREGDKDPPFMTYHARSAARCHCAAGERVVRVRRITIWSKA